MFSFLLSGVSTQHDTRGIVHLVSCLFWWHACRDGFSALRARNRANGLVPDATSHCRVRLPGHKNRTGFHYQEIPASVFSPYVSVETMGGDVLKPSEERWATCSRSLPFWASFPFQWERKSMQTAWPYSSGLLNGSFLSSAHIQALLYVFTMSAKPIPPPPAMAFV